MVNFSRALILCDIKEPTPTFLGKVADPRSNCSMGVGEFDTDRLGIELEEFGDIGCDLITVLLSSGLETARFAMSISVDVVPRGAGVVNFRTSTSGCRFCGDPLSRGFEEVRVSLFPSLGRVILMDLGDIGITGLIGDLETDTGLASSTVALRSSSMNESSARKLSSDWSAFDTRRIGSTGPRCLALESPS